MLGFSLVFYDRGLTPLHPQGLAPMELDDVFELQLFNFSKPKAGEQRNQWEPEPMVSTRHGSRTMHPDQRFAAAEQRAVEYCVKLSSREWTPAFFPFVTFFLGHSGVKLSAGLVAIRL